MNMRMLLLPLLAALAAAPAVQSAPRPDQAVPDTADVYFELRHIGEISAKWKKSPSYQKWISPELEPVRKWVDDKIASIKGEIDGKDKRATEKLRAMAGRVDGRVVFVLQDFPRMLETLFQEMQKGFRPGRPGLEEEGEEVSWPRLQARARKAAADDEEAAGGETTFDPKNIPAISLIFEPGADAATFDKDMTELIGLAAEASDADTDEKAEMKAGETKVDEVTLRTWTVTQGKRTSTNLVWGAEGSFVVISAQPAAAAGLLASLRKGSAVKPLASHPDYARALAQAEKADIVMFFNLTSIMAAIEAEMLKHAEPNPLMGVSVAQIAQRLELTAMLPMTGTMTLAGDGLRGSGEFGFSRETKLSKVFMPYGREKAPLPGFVPADAFSGAAMRVSIAQWYDSLEALLNSLSPQAGMMLGMMRMGLTSKAGVDLKADILDHLGDAIVTAEQYGGPDSAGPAPAAPPASPESEEDEDDEPGLELDTSQIIALKLKDKASIQTTLGKMLAKMGESADMLKKKDYLGQEYHVLETPAEAGAPSLSYAFLDDYLVLCVGKTDFLLSAIRTHQKPGASLWEDEALREELSRVQGVPVSIQIARTEGFADAIRTLQTMAGVPDLPDFSTLTSLFGSSVSFGMLDGHRLITSGILRYAGDK